MVKLLTLLLAATALHCNVEDAYQAHHSCCNHSQDVCYLEAGFPVLDQHQGHSSRVQVEHPPPEVVVQEAEIFYHEADPALDQHYYEPRESDVGGHEVPEEEASVLFCGVL